MGAFTRVLTRIASSAPRRARLLSELANEKTLGPQPDEFGTHPSKLETTEDRRRTFAQVERIRSRAVLVYPARSGIAKSRRRQYL
jgi:hypothetical protein